MRLFIRLSASVATFYRKGEKQKQSLILNAPRASRFRHRAKTWLGPGHLNSGRMLSDATGLPRKRRKTTKRKFSSPRKVRWNL